jgi:arylsulfatase A-like enzyme
MILALLPVLAALGQSPPADARPNVLVVIADDWSFPHAGVYGDPTVKTPHFDRLAGQGALFTRAFCAAPTCSASRAALLTGRMPHRLGPGADLWGVLPAQYTTYPDLLAWSGYAVGQSGKGWGPGTLDGSGRTHNPAGPTSRSFAEFLKRVPADRPFCFWHGSQDPHRPYDAGSGRKAGLDPASVRVPPWLPDTPEVRDDLLDYYLEVQRFDATIGELLKLLDDTGRAGNTIVVVTSDNGLPFPRAKANLYDAGTRVPLLIRWPGRIKSHINVDVFVSLVDLAPTLLEAAGVRPDRGLDGRSLVGLVTTGAAPGWREAIVTERERHANVRQGDVGYPSRALRDGSTLYIHNFEPGRWPAGDPTTWHSVGPFGDIDPGPTKDLLVEPFLRLATAKRPAEELYDLRADPAQLKNLADDPASGPLLQARRAGLDAWMRSTADPRADGGDGSAFDRYPYVGPPLEGRTPPPKPPADNALTDLEATLGWRLLFDGKTTAGWTTDKRQPSKTPVVDGALDPHGAGGYMLVHEQPVGDFVLALDFQITPGCNSGVFVRTEPLVPRSGKDVGYNGIEIAIDDTTTAGYHDTGAIYDLVKPSRNAMRPAGRWNHLVIVCDGPRILVELNGEPVTRMDLDEWTSPNRRPDGTSHKFDVAYRDHPRRGYVGLQDHGASCQFRNLKLLPIR